MEKLSLIFPKPLSNYRDVERKNAILHELQSPNPDPDILRYGYLSGNPDKYAIVRFSANDGEFNLYRNPICDDPSIHQRVTDSGRVRETFLSSHKRFAYASSYERLSPDGMYSVVRKINGEEYNRQKYYINNLNGINPPKKERKFLTGKKGLLEKYLLKISQDSNGCERPILRIIAGKIINSLRKAR